MPQISIPKGRVSRLMRPENVKKGDWFFVVNCKGCGRPIYLLRDPSGGLNGKPFVGEGKYSTECPQCFCDGTYDPQEIYALQSPHNIKFRVERPKPSGSTRQPLKSRFKKVRPTFSAAWLADRPEVAAGIGRCIALWTEVEINEARLLATILRANTEPAVAMFLAIRNGRVQTDVLSAAARAALSEADYELFGAVMRIATTAGVERNHIAHGQYGGAYAVKDGALWTDPAHVIQHDRMVELEGVTERTKDWARDRTFIYRASDLETVATMIEEAHLLLGFLTGYLGSENPEWRAERYPQLCAIPHIQAELSRMREAHQRDQ